MVQSRKRMNRKQKGGGKYRHWEQEPPSQSYQIMRDEMQTKMRDEANCDDRDTSCLTRVDFDFREELPFGHLLILLDRYRCTVQVKGGTVQFKPKVIVITSPYCILFFK